MENVADKRARGLGPRPATSHREGRVLSRSRAAVLEVLREADAPRTLADLAETTGLHANTLREHLEALTARGLVERHRAAPSGRGRPAWLYRAVPPGVDSADSEYAGLAAALAEHLHRTSPDPRRDAVEAGRRWGRDLARRTGPPHDGSVGARHAVVGILDEVGFAPASDEPATVVQLTRCPLLETATAYPDVVCSVHLGIVRGALEEYGAPSGGTDLHPFSDPGSCRLDLLTRDEAR